MSHYCLILHSYYKKVVHNQESKGLLQINSLSLNLYCLMSTHFVILPTFVKAPNVQSRELGLISDPYTVSDLNPFCLMSPACKNTIAQSGEFGFISDPNTVSDLNVYCLMSPCCLILPTCFNTQCIIRRVWVISDPNTVSDLNPYCLMSPCCLMSPTCFNNQCIIRRIWVYFRSLLSFNSKRHWATDFLKVFVLIVVSKISD